MTPAGWRDSSANFRKSKSALIAAGFESAEVRIYAEKLVSRRDQLIRDLDLADEIPLLRPNGIDHGFSYDSMIDGPVRIRSLNGAELQAPIGRLRVRNGHVEKRAKPPHKCEFLSDSKTLARASFENLKSEKHSSQNN